MLTVSISGYEIFRHKVPVNSPAIRTRRTGIILIVSKTMYTFPHRWPPRLSEITAEGTETIRETAAEAEPSGGGSRRL